jgi:hypothetical protein
MPHNSLKAFVLIGALRIAYIGLKTWYSKRIAPGYDWVMLLPISQSSVV